WLGTLFVGNGGGNGNDRSHGKSEVVAVDVGGVKARDGAVEIKRVGCLQDVPEHACELVKGDGRFGEHELHALTRDADSVAAVARCAVRQKARMQLAVDDEHRTGL